MKRKFKIILALAISICSLPVTHLNAQEKKVEVIPCERAFNTIRVMSSRNARVNSRLPKYAVPGVTLTVTESYSRTITNSFNLNLFPELFDLGYSQTIQAGFDIGWSKTNNTNDILQLVILEIYDIVKITSYYEVSPGMCAWDGEQTREVIEGWTFDLR